MVAGQSTSAIVAQAWGDAPSSRPGGGLTPWIAQPTAPSRRVARCGTSSRPGGAAEKAKTPPACAQSPPRGQGHRWPSSSASEYHSGMSNGNSPDALATELLDTRTIPSSPQDAVDTELPHDKSRRKGWRANTSSMLARLPSANTNGACFGSTASLCSLKRATFSTRPWTCAAWTFNGRMRMPVRHAAPCIQALALAANVGWTKFMKPYPMLSAPFLSHGT
mmetsp:Transcript_45061/g.130116  ORF Transcript_45061/g.130116 Transcript_45061/m.130116 type:complete len:221 (-) Transcript_45061:211-873(-)